MEIACPRCGLMRMVDEPSSAALSEQACPRCVERAELLGGELARAQRDSEASLPRRGDWHVLLRGLQRGPYSLPALRQLLLESDEGGAARVWRAGMLDWVPAHDLALLAQEPTSPPQRELSAVGEASDPDAPSVPMLRPAGPPLGPGSVDAGFQQASTSMRPTLASRAAGETTLVLPVYRAASARAVWLRWMALASLASIAAMAAYVTLRRSAPRRPPPLVFVERSPRPAPAPLGPPATSPALLASSPIATPTPSADVGAGPVPSSPAPLQAREVMAAPPAPLAVESAPQAKRDVVRTSRLRVRAGWAPVRAATAPDAEVVCSLARGTQLEALAQRPATHGRWFQVACDKHARGWVHENYVRTRRRAPDDLGEH
jgi:hypothetical protein